MSGIHFFVDLYCTKSEKEYVLILYHYKQHGLLQSVLEHHKILYLFNQCNNSESAELRCFLHQFLEQQEIQSDISETNKKLSSYYSTLG